MVLAFLDTSDEKRALAVSEILTDWTKTNERDILAVMALSDPAAIKKFNAAARFWACARILQDLGIDQQSTICARFCIPEDSFKRYNQISLKLLWAKKLDYLLPPDIFCYFNQNGIK